MATLLSRLGRFSYRRRGLVLGIWIAVLALLAVGAFSLHRSMASTMSIPGTESQQALDLLEQRMPEASVGTATANIVFTTGSGRVTDPDKAAAMKQALAQVSSRPHVATVIDPLGARAVSPDGRTAVARVVYDVPSGELTSADRGALEGAVRSAQTAGLRVELGGSAMASFGLSHVSEVVALGVAALVLFITFGSVVAMGMPLVTAGIGLGASLLAIQIATRFVDLQSVTLTLALMIGLAVGIDYALFIVSRYRHELIVGRSGEEAAGRATATAGTAVLFAGLTVVIALCALTVAGVPFLTWMGLAAAGAVSATVAAALTALPAVLGLAGGRVLGRRGHATRDTEGDAGRTPLGERWARLVTRFRMPGVVAVVLVLLALAVPAADLRLGMPNDSSAPSGSTQHAAYEQVSTAFGPGFNGPLVVALDLRGVDDAEAAAGAVMKDVGALPGVARVTPPVVSRGGDTAIVTVVPASGPSEQATTDLVNAIRERAAGWRATSGATALVTGETAMAIDTSAKLQGALIPYLAVIVGLAFVLLTVMFRSLLVPLKAVLGFLLSILATFGAVVAVFQWGWLGDALGVSTAGPIIAFAPIFLIGILFGLAMDYEVFLTTRIREEHLRGDTADDAIAIGFRHGARVVIAAAVIMISVFGGFVLQSDPTIKTIGFAFAFGVLVDAFLVRMTFGPAVMSLLGERAWRLPRWLGRVLPKVDVEGAGLPDDEDGAVRGHARTRIAPGQVQPEPAE